MTHDVAAAGTAKHIPGEEGVWVLIFGDLVVFALFFVTYITYRVSNEALYLDSQALLSRGFGLANTVLLLTSSLFVAQALRAVRAGKTNAPHLIAIAIACGIGFCIVKAFEYGDKLSHGISLHTNEFFMFYFMFTGIHLVHVVFGVAVLAWVFGRTRTAPFAPGTVRALEGGGAFWHLVDLLWVVLFALFYLMK